MASSNLQIPGINGATQIAQQDGKPTQLFITWFNGLITAITTQVNSNTNAIALIQAQQAQLNAVVQQLQATQTLAANAQQTADAGVSTGAKSGQDVQIVTLSSTSFTTVATVALTGVAAGNLTIQGSGANQLDSTTLSISGIFTGNWQIVENPGATVVYSGSYTAQGFYDSELGATVVNLWNNVDTSTVSIARTTTGSITYLLQMTAPAGVTVGAVQAYLYVRRS